VAYLNVLHYDRLETEEKLQSQQHVAQEFQPRVYQIIYSIHFTDYMINAQNIPFENSKGRNHLKDQRRWKDNTKIHLQKLRWSGFFWLKICTSGAFV
jgi:hypothetical protein